MHWGYRVSKNRKILIMGLPGAGKSTLANLLAPRLNAVHFNADQVRKHVNKDLGFSEEDRIEQARRMGWLCDQVVKTGGFAVFHLPHAGNPGRLRGGGAGIRRLDGITAGRFEDTNRLFVPPEQFDLRVPAEGAPEYWVEQLAEHVRPVFDPKKPTALFIGRYQPFNDGHKTLIIEGLRRVGQACIAVRDSAGTDAKNPFGFEYVRARIELACGNSKAALSPCRFRISRTCSMAAMSATRSSGSISMSRWNRFRQPKCAPGCNARRLDRRPRLPCSAERSQTTCENQ
jgi:adenylylsulfate kinase